MNSKEPSSFGESQNVQSMNEYIEVPDSLSILQTLSLVDRHIDSKSSRCYVGILFPFLFLLLALGHTSLKAAIDSKVEFRNVNNQTRFMVDNAALWSVEEAVTRIPEFEEADCEVYNFGMNDDALWVLIDLSSNPDGMDQLCILEPRITLLDVYDIKPGGTKHIYSSGQARPHASRGFDVPIYHLDLSKSAPGAHQVLVRIVDRDKRNIPLYMGSKLAASTYHRGRALVNGFYFGLLAIMILYNSFVYIGLRDRNYLYYIIFLVLISFAQGHMSGLAQFYIFPDIEFFKNSGATIFSPLAGCMAIFFIMNILRTREKMPWIHRVLILSIGLYLTAVFFSVFSDSKYAYLFMQLGNLVGSFSVFLGAIVAVRKGSVTGIFILAGWSFLITGIVLYVLTEIGVLTFRYRLSPHLVQIGSAFEVLLFSFALAERINRYKEDKLLVVLENERLLKESVYLEKKNSKRLADMEITALRGQMNPHFVFNALGAIQYYMQTNDNEQADVYLTKFALLMRKYLESSRSKLISLREEIELLRLYTDLEMMRFGDKFKTHFHVDSRIDLDKSMLPSMMVQPFVENAIKHGLNDRVGGDGELEIRFSQTQEGVDVAIVDNGVGMEATAHESKSGHISRGMELIRDRIATYQSAGAGEMSVKYAVLHPEEIRFPGTVVLLSINRFNDSSE